MASKAIFFDIDGTIYEQGKSDISEPVKKSIKAVQSMGHRCFIASGRPFTSLPDMITNLNFDGYICGNGTQIAIRNTLLKQRCLDPQKVQIIIQLFETMNLEYIILTTSKSCLSKHHSTLTAYYKTLNIDTNAMCTEYQLNETITSALKVEVMTHNTPEEISRIRTTAESLGFFVEVLKNGYIELSDKTITKGTAMLDLLDYYHIPVENSICIGDGLNDLDMFHTAGYCIAMGNAVDDIKAIADELTLPVSQDGVAHILHHLFHL